MLESTKWMGHKSAQEAGQGAAVLGIDVLMAGGEEAEATVAAARAAGPVPFEDPHDYRRRMRGVTKWMKEQGTYPKGAK